MTVVDTEAIAELRQWPQWVVWRQHQRDGKATKVPYNPTEPQVKASSTDPNTWTAHSYAAAAVERGIATGIGFVFSAQDEYAGVDLDHCVTAGHVDPHALDIVHRLDSYTELSPSGAGLHIIVRAAIRGDRNRTSRTPWGGEFESYDQGRFFTVTGQHLDGTPTTIEARQEQLDDVRATLLPTPERSEPPPVGGGLAGDDEELLRRAREAKNGPRFEALYFSGANGHESSSEADLALCNMLAFWTGPDPDRIDRLFRRSALMRDKWDSTRPRGTYGSETITKAIDGRTEFYSGPTKNPPRNADGREGAVQDAREELAAMLGLDQLALTIISATASARDSKAAVEVHISDGAVLKLDPLSAYTTAPKLSAEIAFQLGAEPTIKARDVNRTLTLLRTICEYREAVTLDERAADYGISFLQEAKVRSVDMADRADRFNAFVALAATSPVTTAKKEDTSIAAESTVLEDAKTGLRYVRIAWYAAYVRGQSAPGVTEDVLRRMRQLGWTKPGAEGRVKATAPSGETSLIWAFFTVPPNWERD